MRRASACKWALTGRGLPRLLSRLGTHCDDAPAQRQRRSSLVAGRRCASPIHSLVMSRSLPQVSRRSFLTASAMAAAGTLAPFRSSAAQPVNPRLGMDNFSVRAMGWKARALVDYAASLALDSLFITDLDAFESLEEAPLKALREYAAARRLQIQVGTWSICPTSKAFKPKWGTAEEHLALGIRVARAVGSPVIRVVLGTWEDRLTDGGIDRHIERDDQGLPRGTVTGHRCRREDRRREPRRRHALHRAGAAGRGRGHDYVGVNFDSGNALWTLEDPVGRLENLGQVHAHHQPARLGGVGVGERRPRRVDRDGRGHDRSARVLRAFPRAVPGRAGAHRDDLRVQPRAAVSAAGFLEGLARHAGARARPLRGPRAHRPRRRALAAAGWRRTRQRPNRSTSAAELERSILYCRNELQLGRRMKRTA